MPGNEAGLYSKSLPGFFLWFAELRPVMAALSPGWLCIPAAPTAPVASAGLWSGSCMWGTSSSLPSFPSRCFLTRSWCRLWRRAGEVLSDESRGKALDSSRSAGVGVQQVRIGFVFLKLPEIPARSKYRGHWKTSLKQQMSVFPLSLLHQLRVSLCFRFLVFRSKLS